MTRDNGVMILPKSAIVFFLSYDVAVIQWITSFLLYVRSTAGAKSATVFFMHYPDSEAVMANDQN